MSLGRQPPPKPRPGLRNVPADPLVAAQCLGQPDDVRACRLAHLRHGVDERDFGGQERVGRHLDHLCRFQVHGQRRDTCCERFGVDPPQQIRRCLRRHPEDEAIRGQAVLDRVPLTQELGVPGQVHPAARLARRPLIWSRTRRAVPTGTVDLPTSRQGAARSAPACRPLRAADSGRLHHRWACGVPTQRKWTSPNSPVLRERHAEAEPAALMFLRSSGSRPGSKRAPRRWPPARSSVRPRRSPGPRARGRPCTPRG